MTKKEAKVKSDHQSITEDKIADWLSRNGCSLEFQTHAALCQVGFQPHLARYLESKEGKWREIDVCCFERSKNSRDTCPAEVIICCECKFSREHPWVLLSSSQEIGPQNRWRAFPHSLVAESFQWNDEITSQLSRTWHFRENEPWGHSLLQSFAEKNKDYAFEALQKVASAAWDWARLYEKEDFHSPTIVFPCLVVDAPLYLATFDESERRFKVTGIDYGRLIWDGCGDSTGIDVVRAAALTSYATMLRNTVDMMLPVLEIIATEWAMDR